MLGNEQKSSEIGKKIADFLSFLALMWIQLIPLNLSELFFIKHCITGGGISDWFDFAFFHPISDGETGSPANFANLAIVRSFPCGSALSTSSKSIIMHKSFL